MTERSEKKAVRRQQILEAGLKLFVKKGFAATKVSDIAEAVGMSVGLLFHYFPSKERLYEELVRIGLEDSKSALSADGSEPLTFLTQIVNTVFTENRFTAEMFVFMNKAATDEQLPEELREKLQNDNLSRTSKIIAKGQKGGSIRSGDPLSLAIAFWGAVQGVCEIIVQNPQLPYPNPGWLVGILRTEEKAK